jgi:hypothetical protein
MDQVAEQVNWSAVASEAFQRRVNEIRRGRTRMMSKAKIVERLRNAGQVDPKGAEAGFACGRKWAEEKALPRYLRRIAAGVGDDVFNDDPEWTANLCTRLSQTITDDDSPDVQFWEEAIGKDGNSLMNNEDFARGFLAGALEVWEEVRDEL